MLQARTRRVLSYLVGQPVRILEAGLRHEAFGDNGKLDDLLGVRTRYGQPGNYLVLSRDYLDEGHDRRMQHRRSGAGLRRPKAVWSWGVVWVCAGLVVLGCSEGHEAPPSIEVEAVRPRWQALGYRKALWAEGRDLTATDAESLAQIGDAKVTFTGSLERGFEYSMVQIGDFGALSTWNIAEEFLEFASDQGLQPVQEVDFYSNPLVTVEQARARVEKWELSGYIETDDLMDLAEDVPRTQLWLIEGYPLALPSAERERLRAALRERYPAP